MSNITEKEQQFGDALYKKIEILLPGKIKRCQRIIGMFLDYSDRQIIEKSLTNDKLFGISRRIICIEKHKGVIKIILFKYNYFYYTFVVVF